MAGFMADDVGGQEGAAGVGPAGRGDAARAVTDLFRDHHLELVRLALVMVGDQATAEDVVQDAFERLHRGWRGLRQPSSSLAYVRSSVLNGCRSVHRRAAVARKHVPELAGSADTTSPDQPNVIKFCLLRVAANGRSAGLSALPLTVPGYLSAQDVALSPDGTRLAMDVQHCNKSTCPYTGIRVVTIATGTASTWVTRANGAPFNVSWAGNEHLAFEWQSNVNNPPAGEPTGYRLLSLTGPGRNLMASRAIGSPQPEPSQYVPAALVTPDGNLVITSTVQNISHFSGLRHTVISQIVELSANTGQLVRILHTVTQSGVASGAEGVGQADQNCNVLSLGPAGVNALVACPGFGRLDGHRFTALPGFPSPSSSGISGQQAAAW